MKTKIAVHRPGWELLRVVGCFICGSDLQNMAMRRYVGITPGHEIVAVKPEGAEPTLVTINPIIPCHHCNLCLAGEFRDCASKRSIGTDFPGGFAEYIQAPTWNIISLHKSITCYSAGLIEPLACSIRLYFDLTARLTFPRKILIIGDGPIGVLNQRLFTALGFENVVLIGKHRERLAYLDKTAVYKLASETCSDDFLGVDAIIVCSKSENYLLNNIDALEKSAYMFIQTRISDNAKTKFEAVGIRVKRAFAYRREDFILASEMINSRRLIIEDLVSNEIELKNLPRFLNFLESKSLFMKVFVRASPLK